MKITLTIPDKKLKRMAATAAMAASNTLPENFSKMIDETPEIDITEELKTPEDKTVIMGLGFIAMSVLLDKYK